MYHLPENRVRLSNPSQNEQMRFIFEQVENAMKDIHLKEDDFLFFSKGNHRIKISPYRMTIEMRFPDGIKQTSN